MLISYVDITNFIKFCSATFSNYGALCFLLLPHIIWVNSSASLCHDSLFSISRRLLHSKSCETSKTSHVRQYHNQRYSMHHKPPNNMHSNQSNNLHHIQSNNYFSLFLGTRLWFVTWSSPPLSWRVRFPGRSSPGPRAPWPEGRTAKTSVPAR